MTFSVPCIFAASSYMYLYNNIFTTFPLHVSVCYTAFVRYSDWLRAGRSGDRIPVGARFFRTCSDRPWGPPSPLYNVYRRYPLYRRLGGPQGRYGQVRKNLAPTGIRSPDRPACSQSLYRLSYPVYLCLVFYHTHTSYGLRYQAMKVFVFLI